MATSSRAVLDAAQLSFNEELIWWNERGDGPSVPFIECPTHLAIVARLRGRLNRRVLSDAISGVVARHTALRSLYQSEGQSPIRLRRVVGHEPQNMLRVFDESEGAGATDIGTGIEAIRRDIDRPFDLAGEIPIRASCLPMADGSHLLALAVHHIVFDGWSMGLLIRELNPLRADRSRARGDAGRSDYRNYVLWQRRAVERGEWEHQRSYWLKQFERQAQRLPDSTGVEARRRTDPLVKRFVVGSESAARLHAYARAHDVTVAMLMLGVFAMVIHRVTELVEISVGVPIADRSAIEFEETIGLLMNALTIRIDLSRNPTLAEVVVAAHRTFTEAYEYRHLPYECLIRSLGCRDGAAPCPFRVVFNYVNVPQVRIALNGLDCEPIAVLSRPPAAADVSLHVSDNRRDLNCMVIASTNAWAMWIADFERLFESAIDRFLAGPEERISRLALASDRSTL